MSELNQLRQSVHDGITAAAKANVRREIVAHANSPLGFQIVEELAKCQDIAEAALNVELETRIGNGGEVIALEDEMKFDDPVLHQTLTQPASVLGAVASREHLDIAADAGAMTLGVDLAQSVNAGNPLEKMLAHQIAASHRLAMRFMGTAHDELQGYKTYGHISRSVEGSRCASSAARLMAACSAAALTLQRLLQARQEPMAQPSVNISIMNITKETQK